jgi:hypothetical protein
MESKNSQFVKMGRELFKYEEENYKSRQRLVAVGHYPVGVFFGLKPPLNPPISAGDEIG